MRGCATRFGRSSRWAPEALEQKPPSSIFLCSASVLGTSGSAPAVSISMEPRRPSARFFWLCVVGAATLVAAGCGSAASHTDRTQVGPTALSVKRALLARERSDYFTRVREAAVRGARRDFAQGTGVGGHSFQSCMLGLLGEALDRPTITRLVQVYRRPDGRAFAAQALNALAAPLAADCGHRNYVPELTGAALGLRFGKLMGSAVKELGVTYGPYLGVRCRRPNRIGCDRVGIDVVLGQAATKVLALVGGRRLPLRTPGMHNAVRYRDWVGTLADAGIDRPGGPFRCSRCHSRYWAGSPAIYVPVELRVRYADGRRASALFPHVLLSPGWG